VRLHTSRIRGFASNDVRHSRAHLIQLQYRIRQVRHQAHRRLCATVLIQWLQLADK
jgi:hypothetical protein